MNNEEKLVTIIMYNEAFIFLKILFQPLVLDGCNGEYTDETKCNLNKFIKLIKLSSVTKDEFDKICNQSVKDYNLHK